MQIVQSIAKIELTKLSLYAKLNPKTLKFFE